MKIIADLHIHSRFARACSKEINFPNLARAAAEKGLDILGTGDCLHPAWFSEIKRDLTESSDEPGIFKLAGSKAAARFVLQTEISCIYKKGGKVRRVHHILLFPNIRAAEQVISRLEARGCNLRSDGRPIVGLDSKELLKILLDISPDNLLIPAHAWTPWFAVFGSKSGFDSLEECFDELTPFVPAIETGLSSDPPMNWRLSALDSIMLISNSDAHSLPNLGREANAFDLDAINYLNLIDILRKRERGRFLFTIEFYPEEGMYHLDGHRDCGVRLEPEETKKNKQICPKCKKDVTVGVLNRVNELADRIPGFKPVNAAPFYRLVELDKIIAEALGIKGRHSKLVQQYYAKMILEGGSQLRILLDMPPKELSAIAPEEVVEGIKRVRSGKLYVNPGFDGQYGEVHIYKEGERLKKTQTALYL